jgi:prepilin-type N-terminal cleavage/methylation domain-containing protein
MALCRRNPAGFTLTELLIACAIIGVVMAGLFSILASGQQTYLVGSNTVEAQQELRLVIQRMTNEIRNAGYCPTCGTGSPAIVAFSAITNVTAAGSDTAFTIQSDWDGTWDGAAGINTAATVNYTVVGSNGVATVTQRGEQITYAFTAATGTLTRQETGEAQPVILASNLASLTFTYLDAAGTTLTPPLTTAQEASVRTIVVNAVGQPQNQPSTFQAGRVSVAMTDTVRLRNRIP